MPTFVRPLADSPDRAAWDKALTQDCAAFKPDLIVAAGFLKLVGADFLGEFGGRLINTHPALLPSFPGMHSVRDALAHGVKVTGCSVILVDAGIFCRDKRGVWAYYSLVPAALDSLAAVLLTTR